MQFPELTASLQSTKPLVWTLEGITNREEAIQFLMLFENTFPVYHQYMEQIYFRYRFVISEDRKQIIIEPDYELHERLCRVSELGFEKQIMNILPGDVVGKSGLYMKYPRSGKRKSLRSATARMETVIKALYFDYWMKGRQTIPVFSKQGIREYGEGMPNIELSFYNLETNLTLSPFVRDAILSTVFERILALKFEATVPK